MSYVLDPDTRERIQVPTCTGCGDQICACECNDPIEPGHLRPRQHVSTAALKAFLLDLLKTYRGLAIDVDKELADALQGAWLVDLHRAWGAWVEPWWVEERQKRGDRLRDDGALEANLRASVTGAHNDEAAPAAE